MQHDATKYKNPEAFDPDHFAGCTKLAPELANGAYEDRDHYGYGAGRRLCPGIHLAERNLFLAMSKLLWAFDMSPTVDESGRDVPVDTAPRTAYSEGFLVCAKDFPAGFRIRGEGRKSTVMREFGEVESVFAKYEA
jgi:cytochrome P450